MVKKILILNGSPRKNGNTSAIIREFTKGAEESGHIVATFPVGNMNIKGCIGCWKGGKNPNSPCTIKDDMDKIYPYYKEANLVVLASPLYYWNISGQLKNAFDRLWAVAEIDGGANPKKDSVLLMASIVNQYEPVSAWYERMVKEIEWRDLGQVLIDGVEQPGDIEGNSGLQEAYMLGKTIYTS